MKRRDDDWDSLWWTVASPAVWLAHFLASYITVALWCEKAVGRADSLGRARLAVLVYSAVALGLVGAVGWRSYLRHRFNADLVPHDFDNREGRARFMGLICLLLSALAAVGIIYVALPVFFVETCR